MMIYWLQGDAEEDQVGDVESTGSFFVIAQRENKEGL